MGQGRRGIPGQKDCGVIWLSHYLHACIIHAAAELGEAGPLRQPMGYSRGISNCSRNSDCRRWYFRACGTRSLAEALKGMNSSFSFTYSHMSKLL